MVLGALWRRLRALVNRHRYDQDLADELSFHRDMLVRDGLVAGLGSTEAEWAARRALGNIAAVTEDVWEAPGAQWLDQLGQDLRFAFRGFRRSPAFVATVVLTIALALGLNTSVFTIFDAYVLRPLAIRDPTSLYEVSFRDRRGVGEFLSWRQFEGIRALSIASEGFAYKLAFARSVERPLLISLVTGDAFQVLGGRAALGRPLKPDDAAPPTGQPVLVLSYNTWHSLFGADSGVVGRAVQVRGRSFTVVGVAVKGFTGTGPLPPDAWAPIGWLPRLEPSPDIFGASEPQVLRAVLRMAPGVSIPQARAALVRWAAAETASLPDSLRWQTVALEPVGRALQLGPETIAMFAPAGVAFILVLLIACANVANAMLARGIARQREIGIRMALGGSRARLVRQLLTESVLLSIPAGGLGLLMANGAVHWGAQVLYSTAPSVFAPYLHVMPFAPDLRVFAFLLIVSFTSAMLFGLVPALQVTRPDVVHAARGDFDLSFHASRTRGALVVAQIAICSLLLIVSGVLLRGAIAAQRLDGGIQTHHVAQMVIDDSGRATTIARLRAIRGVDDVGASSHLVLDGVYPPVAIHGDGPLVTDVAFDFIDAGYFRVLDVPILRGRAFTKEEENAQAPVSVISAAAARILWPGEDPIGRPLRIAGTPWLDADHELPTRGVSPAGVRPELSRMRVTTVIGVAGGAVTGWLGTGTDRPTVYYPSSANAPNMRLLVHTADAGPTAIIHLDAALSATDPRAIVELHSLDDHLAVQRFPYQVFSRLSSVVGCIALLLTLVGVYGVLSYLVAQRTREIGIRMALGAGAAGVVRLVLRRTMRYAAIGITIGVALALAVSQVCRSLLVIVDAFNAGGYAIGTSVVLIACLAAAWAPSRRAARVDPMVALRVE